MTHSQREQIQHRFEKALTAEGFTDGLRSEILIIESENEDDPDRVFIHAAGRRKSTKADLWYQVRQNQKAITCEVKVMDRCSIDRGLGFTGSGYALGRSIKTAGEAVRRAEKDLQEKISKAQGVQETKK